MREGYYHEEYDYDEMPHALREPYRPSTFKRRWGFKSKNQLPLFMIWEEEWFDGEVIYGTVLFNSRDWIGF